MNVIEILLTMIYIIFVLVKIDIISYLYNKFFLIYTISKKYMIVCYYIPILLDYI